MATLKKAAAKTSEKKPKAEPAKAGQKRFPEDDAMLKKLFEDNLSITEISEKMQRSYGAIRSRLDHKGFIYFDLDSQSKFHFRTKERSDQLAQFLKEKKSIEEIADLMKISPESLEAHARKRDASYVPTLTKRPITSRSDTDDKKLITYFEAKTPLAKIAQFMKKTGTEITRRLEDLGLKEKSIYLNKTTKKVVSKKQRYDQKDVTPHTQKKIIFTGRAKESLDYIANTSGNLFLTGKAGTGKSTVLRAFIQETEKKYIVLAPTGIAAVNVGGQTIHKFLGITPNHDMNKIPKATADKETLIRKLDTIIIDEVSMMNVEICDLIDRFLQKICRSNKPFGGKQMVFVGDLFQLPPVFWGIEKIQAENKFGGIYFFFTPAYINGKFTMIELEKVYRQEDDTFVSLLNAIRNKTITSDDLAHINKNIVPLTAKSEICILTTTNKAKDLYNQERLDDIDKEMITTARIAEGSYEKGSQIEEIVFFKEWATIMMINNDREDRRQNGTIGKITSLKKDEDDELTSVRVEIDSEEYEVTRHERSFFRDVYDEVEDKIKKEKTGFIQQFPFVLGRARTIHKSQGITLDKVHIDLTGGTFSHGQTYVALSRVRSLAGLTLSKSISHADIKLDPVVVDYHTTAQNAYLLSQHKSGITVTLEKGEKISLPMYEILNYEQYSTLDKSRVIDHDRPAYALRPYHQFLRGITQDGTVIINTTLITEID